MIFRFDLSELKQVNNKLDSAQKKAERCFSEIDHCSRTLIPEVRGNSGIGYRINNCETTARQIVDAIELLQSGVDFTREEYADFIDYSVWKNIMHVVDITSDVLLAAAPPLLFTKIGIEQGWFQDISEYLWDNSEAILEIGVGAVKIASNVALIGAGVALVVGTGGAGAVILGGAFVASGSTLAFNAAVEEVADLSSLFIADKDVKNALVDYSAKDFYKDVLGDETGDNVYRGITSTAQLISIFSPSGLIDKGVSKTADVVEFVGDAYYDHEVNVVKAIGFTNIIDGDTYDVIKDSYKALDTAILDETPYDPDIDFDDIFNFDSSHSTKIDIDLDVNVDIDVDINLGISGNGGF